MSHFQKISQDLSILKLTPNRAGGLYENFWPYNHSKHGKYKFEIKFWEILGLSVKNSDFIKSKLNGLHRDHQLTLAFAYPSAWKVRETLTLKPH